MPIDGERAKRLYNALDKEGLLKKIKYESGEGGFVNYLSDSVNANTVYDNLPGTFRKTTDFQTWYKILGGDIKPRQPKPTVDSKINTTINDRKLNAFERQKIYLGKDQREPEYPFEDEKKYKESLPKLDYKIGSMEGSVFSDKANANMVFGEKKLSIKPEGDVSGLTLLKSYFTDEQITDYQIRKANNEASKDEVKLMDGISSGKKPWEVDPVLYKKPKTIDNTMDYIVASLDNSAIGLIYQSLNNENMTGYSWEESNYNPAWWEQGISGAVSVIADLPLFPVGSGANALMGKLGTTLLKSGAKVGGRGLMRETIANTAKTLLKPEVAGTIKGVTNQMASLGTYDAMRDVLEQVADPNKDLGDIDYRSTLNSFGRGNVLGFGIGGLGFGKILAKQAINAKMGGGWLTRSVAKGGVNVAGFTAENAVFVYGNSFLEGRPAGWADLGASMITLGALKAIGGFKRSAIFNKSKVNKDEFELSLDETELRDLEVKNAEEAVKKYQDSEMLRKLFMDDNVPEVTKAKVAWALEGIKREGDFDITSIDTKDNVMEARARDGKLVYKQEYESPEEAQSEAMNFASLVVEKQRRVNAATVPLESRVDIMNKYKANGGDVDVLQSSIDKSIEPWKRTNEEVREIEKFDALVKDYWDSVKDQVKKETKTDGKGMKKEGENEPVKQGEEGVTVAGEVKKPKTTPETTNETGVKPTAVETPTSKEGEKVTGERSMLNMKTDLRGAMKQQWMIPVRYDENGKFIDGNEILIKQAIKGDWYLREIKEGRMTAKDAKFIIESAKLEVPESILRMTKDWVEPPPVEVKVEEPVKVEYEDVSPTESVVNLKNKNYKVIFDGYYLKIFNEDGTEVVYSKRIKGKSKRGKLSYNKKYREVLGKYLETFDFGKEYIDRDRFNDYAPDFGWKKVKDTVKWLLFDREKYGDEHVWTETPNIVMKQYLDAKENRKASKEGSKEDFIARAIITNGGVDGKSFRKSRTYDKDHITYGLAKAYFKKGKGTLDQIALDASSDRHGFDNATDQIEDEDVLQFMLKYKNGTKQYYREKSDEEISLSNMFYEMTGLNVDDKLVIQAWKNWNDSPREMNEWETGNVNKVTDELINALREPMTLENLPMFKHMYSKEEYKLIENYLKNGKRYYDEEDGISGEEGVEDVRGGEEVGGEKDTEEPGTGEVNTGTSEPGENERGLDREIINKSEEIEKLEKERQKKVDNINNKIEIPFDTKRSDELFETKQDFGTNDLKKITDWYDAKIAKLEGEINDLEASREKVRESDRMQGDVEDKNPPKGASVGDYNEEVIKRMFEIKDLPMFEVPELISLAKALIGNTPTARRLRDGLRGRFKTDKGIELSDKLFEEKNINQLMATLAHEIGHANDFFPDETMAHGKLPGRIANLKKYMRRYLPFKPGAAGEITADELKVLKELAKKMEGRKVVEKEVDEEIVKKFKITPSDILDIWNKIEGSVSKDLLEYVKTLETSEKKRIIIAAFNGIVPEDVKKFETVVREKTGKKIKIKEVIKGDWKNKFKELVEKEIADRKLWDEKVLFHEAYEFSKLWRPFNESSASPKFMKYRMSSEELYADAVSGLLIAPSLLKEKAPHFYGAFVNYMSEKPIFAETYLELANLLGTNKIGLMEKRLSDVAKGYKKSEEVIKDVLRKDPVKRKLKTWDNLMHSFVSLAAPTLKKIPNKAKGLVMSAREVTRNEVDRLKFVNGETYVASLEYREQVWRPLKDAGVSIDEFDMLLDAANNMAGRLDKANPHGWQGKEFNKRMDEYIRDKYDKKQQQVILDAEKTFHDLTFKYMKKLYDAGVFTSDQWENIIVKYKDTYCTKWIVDYIEKAYISPGLIAVNGTFKEHASPSLATAVKMMGVIRLTRVQEAKNRVFEMLEEYDPTNIKDPKKIRHQMGEDWVADDGYEVVKYYKEGKWSAKQVDPWVADIFRRYTPRQMDIVTNFLWYFNKGFKPMVTKYNPSFAFYGNPFRDVKRAITAVYSIFGKDRSSWQSVKDLGYIPLKMMNNYFVGFSKAWNLQKGKADDFTKQLIKSGGIDIKGGVIAGFDPVVDIRDDILLTKAGFGTLRKTRTQKLAEKNKVFGGINKFLNGLALVSGSMELASKIGGAKLLNERIKNMDDVAYYTRNYVGTPNWKESGSKTEITNIYAPFSNVILQGIRSTTELATMPNTAGAYWLSRGVYVALPAFMQGLAMNGYFGDDIKKCYDGFGSYFNLNYIMTPLFRTADGKSVGMSIPMDDTDKLLHALTIESVNAIVKGEDKFDGIENAFAIGTDLFPSITPVLKSAYGISMWASNQNIYDPFRRENVIPDLAYNAGRAESFPFVSKWVLETTGLRAVARLFTYNKIENTFTEGVFKTTPVINRMIRVTNKGYRETLEKYIKKNEKELAKFTLRLNDDIYDAVSEFHSDGRDYKDEGERGKLVNEIIKKYEGEIPDEELKTLKRTVNKKVILSLQHGLRNPFTVAVFSIVDAPNNKTRAELIKLYGKAWGESMEKDLVDYMKESGLMSKELKKKYDDIDEEYLEEIKNGEEGNNEE